MPSSVPRDHAKFPGCSLVQVLDSTVTINPSFLIKNIYSTLSFGGHGASAVRERISVELVKLN